MFTGGKSKLLSVSEQSVSTSGLEPVALSRQYFESVV